MRVMVFCGNEPSEAVKAVMEKLKSERHHVIPRNPDYFDTAGLDKSVDLVMVPEGHQFAEDIRKRYATIEKEVEFIAEPAPLNPAKKPEPIKGKGKAPEKVPDDKDVTL